MTAPDEIDTLAILGELPAEMAAARWEEVGEDLENYKNRADSPNREYTVEEIMATENDKKDSGILNKLNMAFEPEPEVGAGVFNLPDKMEVNSHADIQKFITILSVEAHQLVNDIYNPVSVIKKENTEQVIGQLIGLGMRLGANAAPFLETDPPRKRAKK